jgi:hypothetical protein
LGRKSNVNARSASRSIWWARPVEVGHEFKLLISERRSRSDCDEHVQRPCARCSRIWRETSALVARARKSTSVARACRSVPVAPADCTRVVVTRVGEVHRKSPDQGRSSAWASG